MMSAYHIGQLVDKMSNPDKDFRFMACNDLMKDLSTNQISFEDDSTAKVMRALLRLLNDSNGEVQNLAIKCIGLLAIPSKIKQHHLDYLVEELTPHVFSKTEQTRDIHALTLKSMIMNLAPAASNPTTTGVIKRMLPKFLDSLPLCAPDDAARIDVLDLIGEILLRFGECVPDLHKACLKAMVDHLYSSRSAIRKKAINGIGHLASVISPELYEELVSELLAQLAERSKGKSQVQRTQTRTIVTALGTIARTSGSKFSPHSPRVIPFLLQFLSTAEDEEEDDLKEASLQGLEVFLYRSPQEVAAFQDDVLKQLIKALSYDPNYEYGDEDEDERMEGDDDEEEEEEYSDDEDVTWKVRRASAKAIEAMISSHRDSLLTLSKILGPIIIGRFKEREETVRSEIISCYIALLNQINIMVPDLQKAVVSSDEDSIDTDDIVIVGGTKFSTNFLSKSQLELVQSLADQKPSLLRTVSKSMKRHPKTGPKCIELLTALINAYPTGLEDNLDELIPAVSQVLTERNASAQGKMTVLAFVAKALALNDAQKFKSLLAPLTKAFTCSIGDQFYKVCAEGLTVSCRYIEVLKQLENNEGAEDAKKLLAVVEKKFLANDTDQEVREKAITAISILVAGFKDSFGAEISSILDKMTERIGREMTCIVALRSSTHMVQSGVQFSRPQLEKILKTIVDYVRKTARSLRMTCLNFVEKLMKHSPPGTIPEAELKAVLGELPNLISEMDLQITTQAFTSLSFAFLNFPSCVSAHLKQIVDSIVRLLTSSLIQGSSLNSLLTLFTAIVKTDFPDKPTFEALLDSVTSPVYDTVALSRHAHLAIASCAAVITESTQNVDKSRSLAKKLSQQLVQPNFSDSMRLFAMITLGELGRRCPQTYSPDFDVKPEQLAIKAFNHQSEELKAAAAQALGALAVGNLQVYLPFILEQIRTDPKKQYLLLHALKEVIVWESSEESSSADLFRSAIVDIWGMLMANAGGNEDGTRSVVAECLGRLCCFDPEALLPKLKEHIKNPDPAIRSSVVSAIKYMINNEKRAVDNALQKYLADFLIAVRDDDLKVRRVALVVLNSAAHNKPGLLRDLLPSLLPSIYEETRLRKELIKEVEMGPFKHQVDEGLDLRKCAFECMFTLLESCVDKIDITQFSSIMEIGLSDQNNDIKLLNYLTLQKVATLAPGLILQRIERICEPLKVQLNTRVRGNAVKQEVEKLEELKKAVIRVIYVLKAKLPDVERHPQFLDLFTIMRHCKDLENLTKEVLAESQRAVVYDTPMETA